jgi:hypothetical protein
MEIATEGHERQTESEKVVDAMDSASQDVAMGSGHAEATASSKNNDEIASIEQQIAAKMGEMQELSAKRSYAMLALDRCKGLAHKQGHSFKNWKERYIQLTLDHFLYADPKKMNQPIKVVPFKDIVGFRLVDSRAKNELGLDVGKRDPQCCTYVEAADGWSLLMDHGTKDEAAKWVVAFQLISALPTLEKESERVKTDIANLRSQLASLESQQEVR